MKIIWLKTGPLHPLDTGGKIRTYNMLRELKKRHQITYVALCPTGTRKEFLQSAAEYSHEQIWIPWEETAKRTPRFYRELFGNVFSELPYVIQKYQSSEMARRIRELDAAGQHDLIICDFLTPAVNLFSDPPLRSKTLIFQHNVESQIWERLFQNARGLKKIYFRQQWKRLEKFEGKTCAQADGVAAVSEEDCRLMRKLFGLKNLLGAVPTGVDVEYFSAATRRAKQPQSLVFLGSMDWMPNIDGAKFFVEEIFPLVRRKFPNSTLAMVGRNPPPQIKELEKTSGVQVTGTVADVRPYLGQAEVMIVPLRIGGGTRIKIFEGMASGIPVVSTTIGAEGLPVRSGENIFLADSPDEFANRICQLFEQAEWRTRLGKNGFALVKNEFSWEAATKLFESYGLKICAKNEA